MKSDAVHWVKLQELFHLAESVPEADREVLLEGACQDAELRQRVLDILRGGDHDGGARREAVDAKDVSARRPIGPYTLVRFLGSGGMGSVYLVERDAGGILQRAALKILAPHAAGPSFVERFRREQQILASLDHPYITRMLDAGLAEGGQPYLVMEYVEGEQLDEYCDTRKLNVEARLRLFLKICEGVDHAHRNLVVHLDLKPSNILVTADGSPKLLDFGTSKLLQTDGRFTTTISATPSYASPEQLRNEAVTTACDVYSLGVILFENLSGGKPAGEASVVAIIEGAIEEREPAYPDKAVRPAAAEKRGTTEARLRSELAGDLSTIIRKCLSVRPADRYATVNALAADIERYLNGRPVLARPQTALYRVRKFVRRNRGKVTGSVVMALAVLASLGYAEWRQQQAIRDGQRAQLMQTFLYRLFEMANSNFTGKPVTTMKDFLEMGIKVLPEYIKNPADLRKAQLSLAESMYWNHDYPKAEEVWNTVAESAHAAGDKPAEAEALSWGGYIAHLEGHSDIALPRTAAGLDLSRSSGVSPRARAVGAVMYAVVREDLGYHTDENLKLFQYAADVQRENNLPPHEVAEALYYVGASLAERGRLDEALQKLNETLKFYEEDPISVCDESNALGGMSDVLRYQGKFDESLVYARRAYETSLKCHGPEDVETLRFSTGMTLPLIASGRSAEAIPILEQQLPIARKVLSDNALYLDEQLSALIRAYLDVKRFADAEKIAREDLQKLKEQIPPSDRRIGTLHLSIARALAGQGKYREALPEYETAYPILAGTIATPQQKSNLDKAKIEMDELRTKLDPSKAIHP